MGRSSLSWKPMQGHLRPIRDLGSVLSHPKCLSRLMLVQECLEELLQGHLRPIRSRFSLMPRQGHLRPFRLKQMSTMRSLQEAMNIELSCGICTNDLMLSFRYDLV